MTAPAEPARRRGHLIDILLLLAALAGAVWLAALVYHNHLGGHVEAPAAQQVRNA